MSEEEIRQCIAKGEAVRKERLRKKHEEALKAEKESILQQSLVERDNFHQGLKNRIEAAECYLNKVLRDEKMLDMNEVVKIVDLFHFPTILDARVGYKICRYEYDKLICLCWQFAGSRSIVLRQEAYAFWDEMLSYPEGQVTGSIIIALLYLGLLCKETGNILREHQDKFREAGLDCAIVATCKKLLKFGGVMDSKYGNIRDFSWKQMEILKGIIEIFDEPDYRTLEEIAQNSGN